MELKNRVAIITGAGSGIGEAIARFYVAEGASVFGCGLEASAGLEASGDSDGLGEFEYMRADITIDGEANRVVKCCLQRFGQLDILVNCAGVTGIGSIDDTEIGEFRRQFEVNVFGLYNMTRAAIDPIRRSRCASIINIISELGVKAVPNRIAYCPSKAAVEMFTRCLAAECGPGVRVNGILPGLTETPMTSMRFENAPDPEAERRKAAGRYVLKRLCLPEDVAHCAVFLASDKSAFITGASIAVCGGSQFTTCML